MHRKCVDSSSQQNRNIEGKVFLPPKKKQQAPTSFTEYYCYRFYFQVSIYINNELP